MYPQGEDVNVSRGLSARRSPRADSFRRKSWTNEVSRSTLRKFVGSRTCKPNSVRRIAAAGRPFLWAAHRCAALATYPEVERAEPVRVRGRSLELPPYLVLLRVGFALPAASLPRRCALTAPFHPYSVAGAVCFLWHFPSDDPIYGSLGALPDVIRHTALRSSDFPPPTLARQERPSGPAAYVFNYRPRT